MELYPSMQTSTTGCNGFYDPKLKEKFGGNRFLESLTGEILESLGPHLKEIDLRGEDYLTHQDEPVEWVYFPKTAIVSEFQMLEDGRTIEVALTGNDGVVGASALLSSNPAINGSQVYVGGKALRLRTDQFDRRLLRNEGFQKALHALIEKQMKHLSQRLICSTFHSMEQRLCTWLLRVNDRANKERFHITHEQMARSLGVHRPSISATLQHLRDQGLFDYGRAHIRISNVSGLEELACTCYAEDRAAV
jgi:CRP-like cAMP-binding protein